MAIVAAAAIGLILFVAFVVSRLLRTRTRGMSIRMQVFLALGVIVGAFAFGLGIMVVDRIEARAVRIAVQAAGDEAASIAGLVAGELDRTDGDLVDVAQRFEHERERGADLRLLLVNARGKVIFPRSAPPHDEEGLVYVDHAVVVRGEKIGAVRVIKPTVVMKNLLADMAPTVLVISLVLGAAAAAAAAMIGRAIAEPIERLSAFGERVSRGERTAPPPPEFGREVTRLSRALDSMRRELSGRPFVETFAADLSHELKNPVAAIRASAEVLEESALEEPAQARHFVQRIREATQRIERLLSELLGLAHIEARGAETFEPVDLARLAHRTLETLGDDRPRVAVVSEGDVRVSGDELWLTRALANLVDNALVHSPPSSHVRIEVERRGEEVWLSVVNGGALERHVQDRLFRRFVTTRADKGGTGLGLAIVQAVAEAHGGQADLERAGPPKVVFRLKLPAARLRATLGESGLEA
ncbi:MAG: HAMP domain-containing protein [Myxococcales bacterium]|nr:MAG: HAMP domain-containing protein [Myxococcales bacterium]